MSISIDTVDIRKCKLRTEIIVARKSLDDGKFTGSNNLPVSQPVRRTGSNAAIRRQLVKTDSDSERRAFIT